MNPSTTSRAPRLEPTRPRPFRTVMVATDLSDGGVALTRALRLPLAHDASVQLCHVIEATSTSRRSALEALRTLDDEARAASGRTQPPRTGPVPIRRRLAWGDPAAEIALEARRTATGLIVLGRRGKGDRRGRLSTARTLLRMTGCPVLVVGAEPTAPYRRPLVATDLALADLDLLLLAARVTAGSAETIRVLHAFEVGFEGRRGLWPRRELTRWGERFRFAAASRLDEFLRAAAVEGVTWAPETEPASPADAVLRGVGDSDLVVLGHRGRLGLDRLVYGSVAEDLLGRVPCDLLIGRPDRCERAVPARGGPSVEPR